MELKSRYYVAEAVSPWHDRFTEFETLEEASDYAKQSEYPVFIVDTKENRQYNLKKGESND